MSDQRGKRVPYKKGLRADYRNATPEQVARSMVRSVTRQEPIESAREVTAPPSSLRDLVSRVWRSFALREKRT